MDGFGVSVESIGWGAHGKSAPTAKSKPIPKSDFTVHSFVNSLAFDDSYSLPVDQLDGIFRSNVNIGKPQQPLNFLDGDYIFAGPVSSSHQYGGVDLESVFCSSNNRKNKGSNLSSRNSVGFNAYDDLLGSMESKSKQRDLADDLIGSFGVNGKQDRKGEGFYDLIQGFGASPSEAKAYSETNGHPSNSSSAVIDDPFLVSESYVSQSDASWPFDGRSEQDTGKGSVLSSIDGFDDFIMGWARNSFKVEGTTTTSKKPSSGIASNGFENTDHLDAIFGDGNSWQWSNTARTSSTAENPPFDDFFHQEKRPEVKNNTPSMSSFSTKKASSTNVGDDFTSLFGDVASSSGEFHEIEGEPKERRMARLNRHMRTNARMAEALAEKNQRDLQSQCEQQEKRRLAETLDNDIKRWAAGKEGNLRALLSSLQQVLGPECGWRPVPITDMITSDSVKKVYKKATLYVHTDKVQQRGATLQQKYIAEKVFNLLKEAWNKFSMEELK